MCVLFFICKRHDVMNLSWDTVPFCQITRSDNREAQRGVHVELSYSSMPFFSFLNLCFISYVIMLVCSAMLRSVPIYFIAKSSNFPPCHWKPLPVLKHNPGWDSSLCLAETFTAWQLKLLTLAFQSISLEFICCLHVCVPQICLCVCQVPRRSRKKRDHGSNEYY